MNIIERREFRKSSKWKNFRTKMKKKYFAKDAITHEPLTRTWELHHLNLDNKKYDDLSDTEMFKPLNENTHKIVHWFWKHIKADSEFFPRFLSVIMNMCRINGVSVKTGIHNDMVVIHKKTGHKYWIVNDSAIDCTNVRDGVRCVVYTNGQDIFVRETSEFWEKFEVQ